jgi:hypothetical protein
MATKGLSARIRRYAFFRSVGRHTLAVHDAFSVLPADGFGEHIFVTEGLHRVQNFRLLVAHRVRFERDRRFHRGKADELHDVVGNHIAQRAGPVIIVAALFDADGFSHRNLHVIDVPAIPDGLKDPVCKTERQNILHRFFSQIMIDAVDLVFAGNFQKVLIQGLGGIEIVPEGFFDDHAPPVAVLFLHEADFRQPLDHVVEIFGRGSHVEKIVTM